MNAIDPRIRQELDVAIHNARAIAKRRIAYLESINTDQWPLNDRLKHLQEIIATRTVDDQLFFVLIDNIRTPEEATQ